MAKQASVQETIGTAGQSRVQAQFEELNWGVAPNPYHDLGTDLWLMSRDDRRFDLGLLVGAQVKASKTRSATSTYFGEPKRENGKVVGWWYRESLPEDHFEDWIKGSIPHIVVLHDLKSRTSYWAHVTKDAITRTKSGTKILVPKSQQINAANVGQLLGVAISQRGSKSTWDGSNWPDIAALGPEDRIRYALLTPRLLAKRHTPRVRSDETPCEAIALLVQGRLLELDGSRALAEHLPGIDPPPFLSADEARAASEWEWNLHGDLHRYWHDGDPDIFQPLIEAAPLNSAQRAAAVVLRTATLIERGRVAEALALSGDELSRAPSLDPVNFAWIEVQHARCLLEVGRYKKVRRVAIHVQTIQAAAALDPTAMAIAASAAGILFRASGWLQPTSGSVWSNDTAAGWWRSQTIAYGLETFLNDRFALWATESPYAPGHFSDTWRQLRTATLLSGFAGDHLSWQTEYSQLAQYTLQTHPTGRLSSETCEGLLTDLRLAGDDDSVKQCVQKLLMAGPQEAVRRACLSVSLLESTHSTGLSDLEFVASAAEVIDQEQADKFVQEAVGILEDQRRYAKRVRPWFLIHNYVLKTLESLMRDSAVSIAGRRVFIDFFLSLPAVTDQSFAHSVARVLKATREDDWTAEDLDKLRLRVDDNWELRETLVGITAAVVDEARDELLGALLEGSTRRLVSVADVSNLPEDVAQAPISVLSESVRREVQEAQAGTFCYRYDARSLAMLNIWHPDVADWAPIHELMNEFRVMPESLVALVTLIRDASQHIRPEIRDELLPRLVLLRDRTPIDFAEWRAASGRLKTVVREAIDALAPGALADPELWNLIGGNSDERCAAARVVGRRQDLSRLDILACLSHDGASTVRAAAAHWIARWPENAEVAEKCNALLEDLATAPGTLIARAIASGLQTEASRAAAGDWIATLPTAACNSASNG